VVTGKKTAPRVPPAPRGRVKPKTRPWSEPPIELDAQDLLPERQDGELEERVDFDIVLPRPREVPFSDVTPSVWSNLDLGKLASPMFATTLWQPPVVAPKRTVGAVLARYRTWFAGVAIAAIGAVGTCAAVSIARKPSLESASAAIVAPRPPETTTEPPAIEPAPLARIDVPVVANVQAPADAVAKAAAPTDAVVGLAVRKGGPRDKTGDRSSPPPRPFARAAEAPASQAPPSHEAPAPSPAPAPRASPNPPPPSFGGVEAADEFNRTAAMEAMRRAGDGSRACVTGGASGGARVAVTFARSGSVADVAVEGSFAGTPVGNCIAGKFRSLAIPPFRGSSVTVRRTLAF
jgi:hypothetical protein